MPITTQNWDGVTAPSASITGWTVASGYATTTGKSRSSPNSMAYAAPFGGYKFLTYNTTDGNSGNVVAVADFYLDNLNRDNAFAVCVRGSATPISNSTRTSGSCYLAEVINEDWSSGSWGITLLKMVSGTPTVLASRTSITTSFIYNGWYQLQLVASGTSLSVRLIRRSDGYYLNSSGTFAAPAVDCLTATDSSISGAGYSGMYTWGLGSQGSSVYTDDFSLDAAASGDVTSTPSSLTGSGTLSTATVALGYTTAASSLIGSGTLSTATVLTQAITDALSLSGAGTLSAATVTGIGTTSPSSLTGSGVLSTVTVTGTASIGPSSLSATGVITAPSNVNGITTVVASPLVGDGGLGFPDFVIPGADVAIPAGFLIALGVIGTPDVPLIPNPLVGSGTLPAPLVVTDPSVMPASLVGNGVLSDVDFAIAGNQITTVSPLVGNGVISPVGGVFTNYTGLGLVYTIYGSDDSGGPVDYATPLAVTPLLTWSPGPLAYPCDRKYAVRVSSLLSGLEEKNLDARIRLILDADGVDITNRPAPPTGLRAIARAAGKIRVEWTYRPPTDPDKRPLGFRIYKGTGGSVDYGTVAATRAYSAASSFSAEIAGLTGGVEYSIGVRAYNASGTEPNTSAVTCTADSTGPDAVLDLTSAATPS